MKKQFLLFLILFIGCKPTQQSVENSIKKHIEIDFVLLDNEINFSITNKSNETIGILNPKTLSIYRFENNSWQKLSILICPCDAPCNAPIEKANLGPNEKYIFSWNKIESRCGKRTEHGVRETIESAATKGNYRIDILIEKNEEAIVISKEFNINN